jgi:hypothetical protein
MAQADHMNRHRPCADRCRGKWLALCLLAVIALFLSLGQSVPAHADNTLGEYVTSAIDADLDCDHALLGEHCCANAACTAQAQLETTAATANEMARGHPLSIAQDIRTGQTLAPGLQPPKHSSQA